MLFFFHVAAPTEKLGDNSGRLGVARYSDGKTAIQWIPVSYPVGKSKG